MLGLGALFDRLNGLAESPAVGWGMVVLGAALLIYAFVMPTKPRSQRRPTSLRTGAMIALGLATCLVEAGTALPYFGAIGIMTAAELSPAAWVPMIAAYNLMMVLPPVLLYLGYRILGERLQPRLERWRTKTEGASREALGWIIGIVGVILLGNGLVQAGVAEFM